MSNIYKFSVTVGSVMNILFFLTPKSEVAYIYEDYTIRQALEKMEYHKYSAIPIISKDGKYVGTITEGDFLWTLKNDLNLDLKGLEDVPVTDINRKMDNSPVSINADIEDLVIKSLNQKLSFLINIVKRQLFYMWPYD